MSLPKTLQRKWPCTTKILYNENTLIGRLNQYFFIYFETFSAPTADTLFLLILSILTFESLHSIRFLYQHFLSGITRKSLNAFYHACSYAKTDYSRFMNVTARIALHLIPDLLKRLVIIIQVYAMYLQIFSIKDKSLHMSPQPQKRVVQNACFSVQFFQNSWEFSVHGMKKLH